MQPFTPITSLASYKSLIPPSTGKTLLIAYWPEDSTSNSLLASLRHQLPPSSYPDYDIVDIYVFDVYSIPELGEELGVSFVPTLMWFMDGIMDAVVWHEGVMIEGESVEDGVRRVVGRVKGAEIEDEGSGSDW